MIKFIDLESKNVFDASEKFVFWFDEGQSTNINYVKKICAYSTDPTLTLSIESNSIFSFLNLPLVGDSPVTENTEIKSRNYKDLSEIKTNYLNLDGYAWGDGYIFMIYIICNSDEVGEFSSDFKINDDRFKVGADFYDVDESLQINLSNFGVELPSQIENAIYEESPYEEAPDNILLNRKMKELLIEYWNVIANKGSYKSLLNSLKWFEYGDNTKLMEYWKSAYNGSYTGTDISEIVDEDIIDMISSYAKTTYIGIYTALEDIAKDPSGNIIYDDFYLPYASGDPILLNEPTPKLEYISRKFTADDLALKMTLVGNFFATYFMPIHLDLIHATIEDLVFTTTIKIINGTSISRTDWVDDLKPLHLSIHNDDNFYLKNVSTRVFPNTVGANDATLYEYYDSSTGEWRKFSWPNSPSADVLIFGFDDDKEFNFADELTEDGLKNFASQYYEGPGAEVPIDFSFDASSGEYLTKIIIAINKDNDESYHRIITNYINIAPIDGKISNTIRLLFKDAGTYTVGLRLYTNYSQSRVRSIQINILDDTAQYIDLYKVEKLSSTEMKAAMNGNLNTIFNKKLFNTYSQSQQKNNLSSTTYNQYVLPNSVNNTVGVGLNHVLICKPDENTEFKLRGFTFKWNTSSMDIIKNDYWVATMDRFDDASMATSGTYYVAIRKYFDAETLKVELYNKTYTINETGEEISITVNQTSNSTLEIVTSDGITTICSGDDIIYKDNTITIKDYDINKTYNVDFKFVYNTYTIPVSVELVKLSDEYNVGNSSNELTVTNCDFVVSKHRFIPLFHKLTELNGYEIEPNELLCVSPELKLSRDITDVNWTFENVSNGESFYIKDTTGCMTHIQEPFIATQDRMNELTSGYYNVILTYKLGDEEITRKMNSAFIIKG